MTEEDEAFNEIERQAKQRMEAVKAAMRGVEDDDIQEYKKPWVGLTLEQYIAINSSCATVDEAVGSTERQLKENNT